MAKIFRALKIWRASRLAIKATRIYRRYGYYDECLKLLDIIQDIAEREKKT
jgi:hypothetical protein